MTDPRSAIAYFVSMGWTVPQSCGIVANLVAESNLNPAAVGDGGKAFGIAQWHGDRQALFQAYIGKDIHGSTVEDQLAFVHIELGHSERAAGDALATSANAAAAGSTVSRLYERPADKEGEATKRAALAEQLFQQYGGTVAGTPPGLASPVAVPAVPSTTGAPMGALLGIFGPILAGLIPQIKPLLDPQSEVAKRNVGLAEIIINTITQAAGQPNLQAAVEAMQADPAVKKTVQEAVVTHPEIMATLQITEIGGGVDKARSDDLKAAQSDVPFWKNSAVFWISVLLLPMIYWYVGGSIVGGIAIPAEWPWYAQFPLKLFGVAWDDGAKVGLANLVVGLVLGGICGVFYGVSVTQAKQTAQTQQAAADKS